jgi:hypothetical protein
VILLAALTSALCLYRYRWVGGMDLGLGGDEILVPPAAPWRKRSEPNSMEGTGCRRTRGLRRWMSWSATTEKKLQLVSCRLGYELREDYALITGL